MMQFLERSSLSDGEGNYSCDADCVGNRDCGVFYLGVALLLWDLLECHAAFKTDRILTRSFPAHRQLR